MSGGCVCGTGCREWGSCASSWAHWAPQSSAAELPEFDQARALTPLASLAEPVGSQPWALEEVGGLKGRGKAAGAPRRRGLRWNRQRCMRGWAATPPVLPASLCPPHCTGWQDAGLGSGGWSLGTALPWPWKWNESGGVRWGQGAPWGHAATAVWVPLHPGPRTGPWYHGSDSRNPPVPAGASALPACLCACVCVQACSCAAERACACKCVCAHACAAAGVCGHAGQRWVRCVGLPAWAGAGGCNVGRG